MGTERRIEGEGRSSRFGAGLFASTKFNRQCPPAEILTEASRKVSTAASVVLPVVVLEN